LYGIATRGNHPELGTHRVHATVLATGRPWRTFRSRRGQLHYSGWYWSSTVKRLVAYESRLELARLLLADFDPGVVEIAAQPFRIEGARERRPRRTSQTSC
jgi:hypothetical protein